MEKWKDPLLTLGERCVAFSENEMNNHVKESYPGSYTSDRIKQYFSIDTRLINGKEVSTGITSGNWCSAGVCFALHESLLPGESQPHGYRAGVVEVVYDLQKNGLYRTIDLVRNSKYQLKIGDVVIFNRSNPNNPNSAWWRHIARISSLNNNGFECISGNNGGTWKISNCTLSQSNILGFGAYSDVPYWESSDQVVDWSSYSIDDINPPVDTGAELDNADFFDIYQKTHSS
jgi:hypothetical protein